MENVVIQMETDRIGGIILMDILRNSGIIDIFGSLSYMSWFFGDFKFVLVVNNITHRKCM